VFVFPVSLYPAPVKMGMWLQLLVKITAANLKLLQRVVGTLAPQRREIPKVPSKMITLKLLKTLRHVPTRAFAYQL
jgi:hypothetical protein